MRRASDGLPRPILVAGPPRHVLAQPRLRVGDQGERRQRPRQGQLPQFRRRAAWLVSVRKSFDLLQITVKYGLSDNDLIRLKVQVLASPTPIYLIVLTR